MLLNFVELADAIFWDDSTIYLMHNKMKFDGSGSRDLTNQILTASEYLQKKMSSTERHSFLLSYYQAINQKYTIKKKSIFFSEADFVQAFETKKIYFIAGYLKDLKKSSRSTYSKYLSIELNKKLSLKSYGCILMGIQD